MADKLSRRMFIQSLSLSAGVTAIATMRADTVAMVCADPAQLDTGQQALRQEFKYVEQAADPARSCATCSFFARKGDTACGHCEIFGGPANARGHCDSWGLRQ